MSGDLLKLLADFGCLVCTGAAVKIMDDALDAEYDICRGKHTLAVKLGRATLPYTLVIALVGAYLNLSVAISVFLGSYAVGMLTEWRQRLPTQVPAWVEMVGAAVLSLLLTGWQTALWGLALMAMFDWVDDLIDMTGDKKSGQRNIAHRIGVVETALLTLTALCAAVLTNAWGTAAGFIAFALLTLLSEFTTSGLWHTTDDGGVKS